MPVPLHARSAPSQTISSPKTEDKFPYGWRYKTKTLPNGEKIDYEEPLTAADFLDPQLGDCFIQSDKHFRSRTDLFTAFDNYYAKNPPQYQHQSPMLLNLDRKSSRWKRRCHNRFCWKRQRNNKYQPMLCLVKKNWG